MINAIFDCDNTRGIPANYGNSFMLCCLFGQKASCIGCHPCVLGGRASSIVRCIGNLKVPDKASMTQPLAANDIAAFFSHKEFQQRMTGLKGRYQYEKTKYKTKYGGNKNAD